MRRGFSRDRRGQIRLRLDPLELTALDELLVQLLALVEPERPEPEDPLAAMVGIDPHATESDDPAVRRLFPAAYLDDDEAASEFRRFTERSLRQGKADRARAVMGSIQRLVATDGQGPIDSTEVNAWLGSLNDLRLILASRLGIDDDDGLWRDELHDVPEAEHAMMLYDWLTWLQDALVNVIDQG